MNELAGLRDIHLPAAAGWWPLAPGWWLLLAIGLFVLLLMVQKWRRRQRQDYSQALDAALQQVHDLQSEENPQALVQGLSVLLRRVAVTVYGRRETAGLTGQAWLEFLDEKGRTDEFSHGRGRVFAELPYRKNVRAVNGAALAQLVERWVKQQRRPHV